jgi:hypothetical protein
MKYDYRRMDRSFGKTRKKTEATAGRSLRKREATGNRRRQQYIALCGRVVLEEAVDMS